MTFYTISCLVVLSLALSFSPAQTQTEPSKCPADLANLIKKSVSECEEEETTEEITEAATDATSASPRGRTKRPRNKRPNQRRKRPREERQRERENRRNQRRNERVRERNERIRERNERIEERNERIRERNGENRSRRQAVDQCLADKIKISEIGMAIISKCEEAGLGPSLLDVRILTGPDEELNKCLADAINQC